MKGQEDTVITKREYECMFWLSNGLTAKGNAEQMYISSRTIVSYMKKIRFKTNLHRRSHVNIFFRDLLLQWKS